MPDLYELLAVPEGQEPTSRQKLLRTLMIKNGNQREVAEFTHMSPTNAGPIFAELEGLGLVTRRTQGRDVRVALTAVPGVAVGVELGFQSHTVAARPIHQPDAETVFMPGTRGARDGVATWTAEVRKNIRAAIDQLGLDEDDIVTVGLGVTGVVDPTTGTLTPPAVPPWTEKDDPAAQLQAKLRADASADSLRARHQVKLDNDSTLAALAESVEGGHEGESLLYVKVSTGVGAGLVVGNQVIRGERGAAGEIGHTFVEPRGEYCQCGGRGCLETVIGANALVRKARAALTGLPTIQQPNTLAELIALATANNLVCLRVLHEAAVMLGDTLGNVCNVLNPTKVVIGGGFAKAGDLVLGELERAVRNRAMRAATGHDKFSVAVSGLVEPSARGALIMGIQGAWFTAPAS